MHHGTIKKAKKLGVRINENLREQIVTVTWKKYRFVLPYSATAALNEMENVIKFTSKSEYRNLRVSLEDREFIIRTKDNEILSQGDTVHEAINGIPKDYEGVADAEDDAEREYPSLAALQRAKPIYKGRGDINNCGDWLALFLKEEFLTEEQTDEGKVMSFNIDGFTDCLEANGVPVKEGKRYLPFANRRSKGWKGRYRMNGRQKLEVVVAEKGFIKMGRKKIKVPRLDLSELRKKHPVA